MSEKIILSHPVVAPSENEGFQRISVHIKTAEEELELWFEVQDDYAEYLAADRLDPFVIALLPWAVGNGYDLCSDAPVSQELKFRLKEFFMPFYAAFRKMPAVGIEMPVVADLTAAGGVGVGLSCGVDSMTTIAQYYYGDVDDKHKITHLCFFDAGAGNKRDGAYLVDKASNRLLVDERLDNARKCAAAIGLPLVHVRTNIPAFNKSVRDFEDLSQVCHVSCATLLQKLFSVFYVSSAYQTIIEYYENPVGQPTHIETYESTFLQYLMGSCMTIHLANHMLFRLEKIALLCNIDAARNYLNVCTRASHNCSVCMKCVRTLLPLDILGKQELFSNVFDLEKYRKRRRAIWADSLACRNKDKFMRMLWEYIERNGVKPPAGTVLYSLLFRLKHRMHDFEKAIRPYVHKLVGRR